jgi:hypothetical protein
MENRSLLMWRQKSNSSGKMIGGLDRRSQHTCCRANAINEEQIELIQDRRQRKQENQKWRWQLEEHAQICEQHNTSMKPKGDGTHQQNSEFLLHKNYTRSETHRSSSFLTHLIY